MRSRVPRVVDARCRRPRPVVITGRVTSPNTSGVIPCVGRVVSCVLTNTPVEALERAFPLRVRRYSVRAGSGGGKYRGGDGIERDVEVLEPITVSLVTERRVSRPWGLAGGEPGAAGENWLVRGGDETTAEPLPDKCTVDLDAADVIRMRTPGGGGWGDETKPVTGQ